jgi:hypothetical protein
MGGARASVYISLADEAAACGPNAFAKGFSFRAPEPKLGRGQVPEEGDQRSKIRADLTLR